MIASSWDTFSLPFQKFEQFHKGKTMKSLIRDKFQLAVPDFKEESSHMTMDLETNAMQALKPTPFCQLTWYKIIKLSEY